MPEAHHPHPTPSQPTEPARILCPYCGEASASASRCDRCRGYFDPLSRQATQNRMGPWFVRDPARPFLPGCDYQTIREWVQSGRVGPDTVIRGPTTHQFWMLARRTPSIANLFGECHNCRAAVKPEDYLCARCGAVFAPDTDRQHLGLAPVHLLPGSAPAEAIARSTRR